MSQAPAITIGIMTRNYARYVGQAIDSVLAQKRTDWELVISDDASTDDTPAVIAPYLHDPRIRYVRHAQNLGQADNWRFLLAQGTAPVIAVLHADDYWLPETLETALAAFGSDPDLDLLYGNWQRMVKNALEPQPYKAEADHRMTGAEEFRYQITRNTWLPSAAFLSRRVVQETGWPNPQLRMVVDGEYFLRIALRARAVRALSQPVMVYRVHPGNATVEGTSSGLLIAEREQLPAILRAELSAFPALSACEKVLRRGLARWIFSEGVGQVTNNHLGDGRALMRRALRLDPSLLIFSPNLLPDYILSFCGSFSLPVYQRLHKNRIGAS